MMTKVPLKTMVLAVEMSPRTCELRPCCVDWHRLAGPSPAVGKAGLVAGSEQRTFVVCRAVVVTGSI
jgi:hypothetical protein